MAALALVPLTLAKDAPGKEILYPVATVILGSLLSSTFLDIVVTPVVFWLFGEKALTTAGFALLKSPAQALANRVKPTVAQLLRRSGNTLRHREFIPALARDSRRLHAAFARLPGHESLLNYITNQRLAYAQELLATSRLDIGRIARQLDYCSLAHFSGQFRRFAQCSPSIYRQQVVLAQNID